LNDNYEQFSGFEFILDGLKAAGTSH